MRLCEPVPPSAGKAIKVVSGDNIVMIYMELIGMWFTDRAPNDANINVAALVAKCIRGVATTTLEAIGDDILAALEKPNPNIKTQTDFFLYRVFKLLNAQTMPKKTLKSTASEQIKHTADSDAKVRDASYATLGLTRRAIGEKPCVPILEDILDDKLKMGKIKVF
ncbi:unnamed protein product [Haemonchus placei]|uniref:HEAT repeat protein n=1 Tax=Haemonchus placei TaxID=6290 RepID=A0A0N4WGM0_HAEPC|nr:unnamed protein product [Haemonchus placei]